MCGIQTSLVFHKRLVFLPQGTLPVFVDTKFHRVVNFSRSFDITSAKLRCVSGRGGLDVTTVNCREHCFGSLQSDECENSGDLSNGGCDDGVTLCRNSQVGNTSDWVDVEKSCRDDERAKMDDLGEMASLKVTEVVPDSSSQLYILEDKVGQREDREVRGMHVSVVATSRKQDTSESGFKNGEEQQAEGLLLTEIGGQSPVEAVVSLYNNSAFDSQIAEDASPGESNGTSAQLNGNSKKATKCRLPLYIAGVWELTSEALKSNTILEWIKQCKLWQQKRRLEHLRAEADAHPMDASKQSALLMELNQQHSPEAVIKRFEQRGHATDGKVVVEYLRALVATNTIVEYLPDERHGKASSLPTLLQDLKHCATGNMDEAFSKLGVSEKHPMHVVMVDAKAASKSIRILQELLSTILFMIFFSVMWVMVVAFLRKYVSSVSGLATSSGIGASTGYAPKEYNKENTPEKTATTFKDVKGCDEAKSELEEIVEYLKNPAKFTRLGGKLPKGVLLIGPPGTGKTLLAKAVAGEAGVPFFYRAGSEFEEMFVGVGARRVRALFQAAKKKAPCIVFIDEIDAVGSTRKQWEGHTKKTLHQLLVEMDGFEANEGIILMAATNLPESLDPALTRPGRFDIHVVVTNPDVRGRQEILELYLQNKPLADDIDLKSLARGTTGFNGADLANLVNMAALKAAVDGTEKIMNAQLEFAKDKILMGTERKSLVLSEESRKLTAYHESGHAIVAFNTAGAYPIHKATITPRGTSLGMVSQLPDKDENSLSKMQMLARLDVAMGGRVAEELIFGCDQVTSGARSDLQHATSLARHMVSECGMSDAVGPVFIGVDDHRPSQEIQRSIDSEVVRLLKEAYERVRTLLRKHEADLHALAMALLEHETLTAKQIQEILSPCQQVERQNMQVTSST
eukprot:c28385_g1_i1 orf=117-2852(+)